MDVVVGKSPSEAYYNTSDHNLNSVIGNIHLVRAKTDDITYDGHQLSMKASPLVAHHHHEDLQAMGHDSNNNDNSHHLLHGSGETFLNLVPPPPHLAAELGRKCMTFNAEQVSSADISSAVIGGGDATWKRDNEIGER